MFTIVYWNRSRPGHDIIMITCTVPFPKCGYICLELSAEESLKVCNPVSPSVVEW